MTMLIFWIVTIMISFSMNFSTILQMFKDVADGGYIINKDNIGNTTNVNDEIKPDVLFMLVPIVNIIQSMEFTMKYNNNKSYVINMLKIENALDEMTVHELETYNEKPTGFNAFILGYKKTLPEYHQSITDDINNCNTNNDDYNTLLSTREKIEELTKAKEELLGTDNKENNGKTKSLKNNKK